MFTAAHMHTNGKIYFFSDGQYWRYDLAKGTADAGYPKRIRDHWRGAPDRIDAAVQGKGDRAHKIYFFSGAEYWRYDTKQNRVDDGYPQKITAAWRGLFADGIDAGFLNPVNGKHYFFKGDQYIRYDFDKGADAGYPKSTPHIWKGLPGHFDCIVMGNGDRANKAYFFSLGEYWRYDLKAGKVDKGYPLEAMRYWKGLGLPSVQDIVDEYVATLGDNAPSAQAIAEAMFDEFPSTRGSKTGDRC